MTTKKLISINRRLGELAFYISKYSNLWGKSSRVYKWVDEYNRLKNEMSGSQWADYCNKMGYAPSHNGYDCLA